MAVATNTRTSCSGPPMGTPWSMGIPDASIAAKSSHFALSSATAWPMMKLTGVRNAGTSVNRTVMTVIAAARATNGTPTVSSCLRRGASRCAGIRNAATAGASRAARRTHWSSTRVHRWPRSRAKLTKAPVIAMAAAIMTTAQAMLRERQTVRIGSAR